MDLFDFSCYFDSNCRLARTH